jgi:hypothetical protein
MKNRVQTETPPAREAHNPTELTHAELHSMSGGLNPQPLPPRVAYNFLAMSAVKIPSVWAF